MIRVDFSFDEALLNQNGIALTKVYTTIKRVFEQHGIPCAQEDEALSFEVPDEQYGLMLGVAGLFTEKEWVLKYATSFLWWEDDEWEDWLGQLRNKQKGT